ncbi:hypothetical protein L6164_001301 [Bauhinia variegata]|uniref:Uncharacterized protein n=1 Tax=Bauhinia variegata TaxID=167791 RepID=A0ACB9Q9N8_BAUVA|nr:hypothetical protein L6164_001301 [Bauhinia variegata]
MASHRHQQKAVHFFKVILKCMLRDGVLRIPSDFTRKYGGDLQNPVFLKPPDGTEWKIYWEKHDDGDIWFEKGWKEFASHYSLDHWYFIIFKYEGTSNLEVIIFNMAAIEIEYPSHVTDEENYNLEKDSDDSVEFLGEGPTYPNTRLRSSLSNPQPLKKLRNGKVRVAQRSSDLKKLGEGPAFQKVRPRSPLPHAQTLKKLRSSKTIVAERSSNLKKCPLPPIHPCKKMRACTNGEDGRTSSLQKKPINGELIQVEGRSNYSTKKCSNSLAITIRRRKPLIEVEKARALQRVSTFSSKYPHFKRVMQPSYVSRPYLRVPPKFCKQHLKKKQGAVLLQALDGRTWSSRYKVISFADKLYIPGWTAFAKDNVLEVGDVCVFEFIQRTIATIRVTISRHEQLSCLVNLAERVKGNARKKSPLLPLHPCKKMRACTNGEVESTSNLRKKPIHRELIQLEAIARGKPLTELEKARALRRVNAFSSEYPHFKRVMQPSYVSKHHLVIPLQFCKQHLKKRRDILLQALDGRTWHARYKVGFSNKAFLSGWGAFAKDNYVEVGNVCAFELIQRNSKSTSPGEISRKGKEKKAESSDVELIGEEAGSPVHRVFRRQARSSSRLKAPVQPDNSAKMKMLAKRKIAYGMVVDFSKDDDMKKIKKRFTGMGWKNFFQVTESVIYDALVRQFYGNLTDSVLGNSVAITTIVDEHEFTLSEEILGNILGVPAEGKRIYCSKRWDQKKTGVSFAQAMEIIADSPIDPLWSLKPSLQFANQITKTMGRIVKMAIMPKLGNLSGYNYNEMNVLFHLKMKLPLNLPFLILNHMIESAKDTRSQFVLPYGMILTRIFKHQPAIDTTAYSYSPMPRNNVIRKPLILKKRNLKRKAEHSPQGRDSKQRVSTSFGVSLWRESQPSFSEHNRWLEYMLRCALSRIDNLQEEVKLMKKELGELKAKQYMERTETGASDDEDDADVDDDEEEEADDSEDV